MLNLAPEINSFLIFFNLINVRLSDALDSSWMLMSLK